jgi:hypothetical protein
MADEAGAGKCQGIVFLEANVFLPDNLTEMTAAETCQNDHLTPELRARVEEIITHYPGLQAERCGASSSSLAEPLRVC